MLLAGQRRVDWTGGPVTAGAGVMLGVAARDFTSRWTERAGWCTTAPGLNIVLDTTARCRCGGCRHLTISSSARSYLLLRAIQDKGLTCARTGFGHARTFVADL